jgi:4-amino-4-deoxy-L-arabinose transferase-like glycosyltransferase
VLKAAITRYHYCMSRSGSFTLLCVALAFAGSLIVSRQVFERLPHLEDEFAYLYQARIFARGQVAIATPQPIRAYWQPFLLDVYDHRFAKYTPGWPLLLAVGARLDAPWIVNAWLAMLTVALVYRLGREVFDPATGAVAALLMASSPAALLLDGTLMSHTASLFFTTLFLYAFWKVEKNIAPQRTQRTQRKIRECNGETLADVGHDPRVLPRWHTWVPPYNRSGAGLKTFMHSRGNSLSFSVISVSSVVKALLWGGIGGIALGMVLIIRPWTAVAVAAPFVVYGAGRVLWTALRWSWRDGWRVQRPLLVLAVATVLIGMAWPAFNYTVSAPRGETFPHYLGRFLRGDPDTNLYLRIWPYDRPGFGAGHGRVEGGHTPAIGWRHAKQDLRCAARDLFGWAAPPEAGVTLEQNACLAMGRGYSWLLLPLGLLAGLRRRWTWLLLALPASLVAAYIAYWVSGSAYSARYYFEGLTAAALVSAEGLTGLVRRLSCGIFPRAAPGRRFLPVILYGALAAVTLYALAIYSPARLQPLRGYGNVSQAPIQEVNRLRRDPDRPVVVIAWGESSWRDVASLMAVTDPHLDSDIVLARDPTRSTLAMLLAQWTDREVIYFVDGTFTHEKPEAAP